MLTAVASYIHQLYTMWLKCVVHIDMLARGREYKIWILDCSNSLVHMFTIVIQTCVVETLAALAYNHPHGMVPFLKVSHLSRYQASLGTAWLSINIHPNIVSAKYFQEFVLKKRHWQVCQATSLMSCYSLRVMWDNFSMYVTVSKCCPCLAAV